MKAETTDRALMNYDTGEFIRLATQEECDKSDNADDGGIGAFTVIVEDKETTCYVESYYVES